jgi:hypothetical protein
MGESMYVHTVVRHTVSIPADACPCVTVGGPHVRCWVHERQLDTSRRSWRVRSAAYRRPRTEPCAIVCVPDRRSAPWTGTCR